MITWDKNASWETQFIVSHPHKAGFCVCVCVEQENNSCHQTKLISAESWNDPTWHLGSAEGRKVCQGRHPDAAWGDVQTVGFPPHWEFSRNKDMQSKTDQPEGSFLVILRLKTSDEIVDHESNDQNRLKSVKASLQPPLQKKPHTHSTPGRYQRTAGQVRLAKGKVCLAVWCLVQKSCHGTTWLDGQKHSHFKILNAVSTENWYCTYIYQIYSLYMCTAYIHICVRKTSGIPRFPNTRSPFLYTSHTAPTTNPGDMGSMYQA